MKISDLVLNDKNPRYIKDERYEKLKQSISEFPKMLELRPIVYNPDNNEVLGGNMRLRALIDLGYKDIPTKWIKPATQLTEEEKQRFIIVDNIGFGEWDYEILDKRWDAKDLEQWGMIVDWEYKLNNLKDGEEIEIPQSVQIEPPKEYILIMCEPNSDEWEELKEELKLRKVRRGGYKKGSKFDAIRLERVICWDDFKKRYANSHTK